MDLSYTSLTGLESLTKPKDLRLKTYGYCKSSDYDNLYFASMPYSDSNSTTPFIVNQLARTIVGDITGLIKIPQKVVFKNNVAHLAILYDLASFDRIHFPRYTWRIYWIAVAFYNLKVRKSTLPLMSFKKPFGKFF